ncbi:MAG TPA: hypothetical protein VKA76_11195, partial [Gammaproteobacteria bacterium]|nr:hypothetical protein [Gammaproteobacteria bacterium]
MSLRHRLLATLAAFLCCCAPFAVQAQHRDAAPLSGQVLKKLAANFATPVPPGAAQELGRQLDALNKLVRPVTGQGGRALSAHALQSAQASRRMLIAGKRQQLNVLRLQVQTAFARTRARLAKLKLTQQVHAWDAFVKRAEQRFDGLDSALAAVDTPDAAKRARALTGLRAELKALRSARGTRR